MIVPEQLTLLDVDWTLLRAGRRPRRDRGWAIAWQGPLTLVPMWVPPPGSQVIDRVIRRGRDQVRELWVRPRPARARRRRR